MDPLTAEPASPCTRVCTLDARDLCLGCGRTLDEIVAWHGASTTEKQAILDAISTRGAPKRHWSG